MDEQEYKRKDFQRVVRKDNERAERWGTDRHIGRIKRDYEEYKRRKRKRAM